MHGGYHCGFPSGSSDGHFRSKAWCRVSSTSFTRQCLDWGCRSERSTKRLRGAFLKDRGAVISQARPPYPISVYCKFIYQLKTDSSPHRQIYLHNIHNIEICCRTTRPKWILGFLVCHYQDRNQLQMAEKCEDIFTRRVRKSSIRRRRLSRLGNLNGIRRDITRSMASQVERIKVSRQALPVYLGTASIVGVTDRSQYLDHPTAEGKFHLIDPESFLDHLIAPRAAQVAERVTFLRRQIVLILHQLHLSTSSGATVWIE